MVPVLALYGYSLASSPGLPLFFGGGGGGGMSKTCHMTKSHEFTITIVSSAVEDIFNGGAPICKDSD